MPDIAPEFVVFQGGFRDSPEWGSAAVLNPAWLASWYGALGPAKESLATARRYVDYLLSRRNATTGLLDYGLGDWKSLVPTPMGVTATGILVQDLQALSSISERLGMPSAAANYSRLAKDAAGAYTANFWNGSAYPAQTAAGMALTLNMTSAGDVEQAQASLVADVLARGNVTTGADIGNRYILQALGHARGGADALWSSLLRTSSPGYGFAVAQNETALPESWNDDPSASHIHAMLGHVDEYLYAHVAGLRQAAGDAGWRHVAIQPRPAAELTWVNCSFEAPSGRFELAWQRKVRAAESEEGVEAEEDFVLLVTLPVGTMADVILPLEGAKETRLVGAGGPQELRATGTRLQ